jgi:hypothetical protein
MCVWRNAQCDSYANVWPGDVDALEGELNLAWSHCACEADYRSQERFEYNGAIRVLKYVHKRFGGIVLQLTVEEYV